MGEFYKQSKPLPILPEPSGECLMNANAKDAHGFVRLRIGNKTVYQHRHLYATLFNVSNQVMKDLIITPSCGRYDCINPDHLIAKPKPALEYKLIEAAQQ